MAKEESAIRQPLDAAAARRGARPLPAIPVSGHHLEVRADPLPFVGTVLLLAALAFAAAAARGAEFYVGRDRWHSGIVVERAAIPAGAWPPGVADRDFAGCRCLELGWGDRNYYPATNPTVLTALRAALIPGLSVLHLAGFTGPPQGAYPWEELVRVPCSPEEFAALCRALGASFALDAGGHARPLGRGLYGSKSQFYAARGRYWIANTCNTWTLREVRAGGLPMRIGPAGTLTSSAVVAQVRRRLAARARHEQQPQLGTLSAKFCPQIELSGLSHELIVHTEFETLISETSF